ncbi:Alpha/Beta hydrolase protein [Mycena leptocephala]|nr:Alpha/Beta hydrolase protein [Mycena leptocephala]
MHSGRRYSIGPSTPVLSFSPVVLPAPGRPVDLELRVTVPSTGDALPIILLSHGHGRSNSLSSLEGYAPLYEFWAAHGFAVLQPTHLSSAFLGLQAPEGQELFWQARAEDMVRILDNLDAVEAAVPGLKGRLDRTRVAVAGHSLGAWTASMLLGASNTDPRNGSTWYKPESRIKAGVVLAGVGNGGADISASGKKLIPSMASTSDLFIMKGAKHGLGGISGWDAGETMDESPERLAAVQRMTWAYLKSQLYDGDKVWFEACKAMEGLAEIGKVEKKI